MDGGDYALTFLAMSSEGPSDDKRPVDKHCAEPSHGKGADRDGDDALALGAMSSEGPSDDKRPVDKDDSEPLQGQQQQRRQLPQRRVLQQHELEQALTWRKNAQVLYDFFIGCSLAWPALTVAWLPDEEDEPCRIAFGTHTDGSDPNEVVVMQLSCSFNDFIEEDPWRTWGIEGFNTTVGFGCSTDGGGPLRPLARMRHPTEVNRVAPCPYRPQLLATKAATGAVLLFDYKAERPADKVSPDATLVAPTAPVDGFALAWSPLRQHILASGGNDGRLFVWDVEVAPRIVASAPLCELEAHSGATCDVSFSCFTPTVLASVGDKDRALRIFDTRAGQTAEIATPVSEDEVLTVDWSHHHEQTLATAGRDHEVRVWDVRSLARPLHALRGHKDAVLAVRWGPSLVQDRLASCSADSRLIFWDLMAKDQSDGVAADKADERRSVDMDASPPQLVFAHAGHSAAVTDFSWCGQEAHLMCSVAEDNQMQIWMPSDVFHSDSDTGDDVPAAKRPKATDD